MPSISVVVPTKGRPHLLERCLAALAKQTLAAGDYEVIVVDDGPSRETFHAVEQLAGLGERIRYLENRGPRHGPAAARNLGWRSANADVIAFTDDDTVPDADWLREGLAAFSDPAVAGAMGRIVVPLPKHPTDHELDTAGLEGAEFATANAFYRRWALEEAGGFDERFTAAWREDADLYFTLLERGHRLVRAPFAIVIHPAREARWAESVRQQRKTQFNALLYRKHPALYRDLIGDSPRWYYTAVAALVAAPLALVYGRKRLATAALGTWLGLTAAFAVDRLRHTSKRPAHVAEMFATSAAIPPLSIVHRLTGDVKYRSTYW